jgi:hypothetical protein
MPRVPEYSNFQATPSAQPSVRFNPSQAPDAGEVNARQTQQMGQALQQSGGTLARLAADAVKDANETRVIDAVNKAKERMFDLQYGKDTGYLNLKGDAALRRPDNQNLADEYVGKFKEQLAPLEQELGNEQQREMFRRATANMQTQLYGDAQRHTAGEFKTYKISTYDGAVSTAQQQIALNYNDAREGGMVDQGVKTIEAAVRMKAREMGLSQEQADDQVRRAASNAHRMALGTALERNDVAFADGYLKKYRGQMTADDILHTQGAITKEMDLLAGVQAASGAVRSLAPDLAPTDFGRMVNITLQTESGGQRYGKDGQLLTSPKGAKGEMQVLDSTNLNPGFGVKPAKDNSPEERARVGRDYLQAMLKRYDGDPAMAWAAYNAGPGKLDEALMRAKASPTPGASWLTFMPNETQAYVAANTKALENGLGRPQAPTLADVQDRVRTSLGADARPQVVQHAVQEATRQWEALSKSYKDGQDQSLADAQRLLIANKGDMNALPMSVRNRIDPGKFDDLMGFASKLAKGEPIATDWGLYYSLASDPRLLKQVNLGALRHKLGESEFKQLTEHQGKLNNPKGEDLTQMQSAKEVLNGFLLQAGMDPTPKPGKGDDSEAAKVGQLQAAFQQRIDARERLTGKKLGASELREEAAQLFKPVRTSGFLGFGTDKPAGLVTGKDAVQIPDNERTQIEAALKRAGRPVTDAAVEALYRAHSRIPQRTAQN